jgi:hypothetical protein
MVTETVTANKQSAATDITVNRFGRKKGDIKVRPGDKPGVIFVDCPANEYGKYPPIEFLSEEGSKALDEAIKKAREERRAAMTPEEKAAQEAWVAELDKINRESPIKIDMDRYRKRRTEVFGYDYDYYNRIYGTDEEIFGAYEELYGSK